jgi:hypothetical protein
MMTSTEMESTQRSADSREQMTGMLVPKAMLAWGQVPPKGWGELGTA